MATDFDVERVARDVLGMEIKRRCGNEIVTICPKCTDRTGHLYMNKVKGAVYCHKCGYSGSILWLCMDLLGIPEAKTAAGILSKASGFCSYHGHTGAAREICLLAPATRRDATYRKFLSLLSLKEVHARNLKTRGFADGFGLFKSTPSKDRLLEVMRRFSLSEIKGVPGFYEEAGRPRATRSRSGIFVPYIDERGLVQGLQIRTDGSVIRKMKESGKHVSKYSWFSSSWVNEGGGKARNGCGGSFTHFAVDFHNGKPVFDRANSAGDAVCGITEGAMKAQLYHQITGTPCIAIAGVGLQSDIPRVFGILRDNGVKALYNFFDMDYITNPNVAKAAKEMERKALEAGFSYHREYWDAAYKGVDDYVVSLRRRKLLRADNRFCFERI